MNNTFGETHNYWLDENSRSDGKYLSPNDNSGSATHYHFRKQFHVSPFLKMDCEYQWTFTTPADSLVVQTNTLQAGQSVFDATLKLEAQEWSARNLHRILLQHPWMTAKVIAGIHWQAIRLWAKHVPVVRHPGPDIFTPVNQRHVGAAWSPRECRRSKLEEEVAQK